MRAPLPPMIVSERVRVAVCVAAGVAVAGATAPVLVWELALLAGWLVAMVGLLGWLALAVTNLDAATTARVATREDNSRNATRVLLLAASVVSLVAVAAALHHASDVDGGLRVALTATAMVAIAVSWLVVHTVFTLRYAHLYYSDEPGGIAFAGPADPCYRDFAYVSFTVGMTFQAADFDLETTALRSTVLRHSLLSYLFGTAIIATTINVVASFVGR